MNLDVELVEQAREALGTSGTTDTVHRALLEAVTRKRLGRLTERRFDALAGDALDDLRRPRSAPAGRAG